VFAGQSNPFPDFHDHQELVARYARDTGIDVNTPEAVMLFMANSPAYPQFRYQGWSILGCHSETGTIALS
jgi:hypothetical protein